MPTVSPFVVRLNNMYLDYIGPFIYLGTLGVILAVIVHYLVIGPNGKNIGKHKPEIIRLNLLERLAHFIRMISTIVLAITGISFALFRIENLGLSYPTLYNTHLFFAALFAISSLLSIAIWLRDNLFNQYDWEWLKVLGGYLTRKEIHPPAGRFNAGQKLFFWLSSLFSMALIITGFILAFPERLVLSALIWAALIHGTCAVVLTATVIGHAYLGSAANPGTLGSIFHGKVAEEWAKRHHPQWFEKLAKSGRIKR